MKAGAESLGTNSKAKATLRRCEYPGKERTVVGKMNVKVPHQRSPNAMKLEDSSVKRLKDSSDVPEARLGILPKTFTRPKNKTRLHSTFPRRNGYSRLEEREFVVDSGMSKRMVSKKDLNSAELETMRTSRSSTTVMTANGKMQTRKETTVYVKQLDLFVQVMFF